MGNHKVTRRDFVTEAAKLGLGVMIVPRHVLGGFGYRAPSDMLNIAIVGFGGQGCENALSLAPATNIVAICDVDFAFAEKNMGDKLHDQNGKPREGKELADGLKLQAQFTKAKR